MKILVIEDETTIRQNLVRMLQMENFEVISAEHGEAGVAAALADLPDLIISDVMMPHLDGFGVLEALRAQDSTMLIPFLFLTALDDKQNLRRAMTKGADDYLTKPFNREELLTAIKVRLARSQVVQRREEDRLLAREEHLRTMFAQSLTDSKSARLDQTGFSAAFGPSPTDAAPASTDSQTGLINATVLFSSIRSFALMSEKLSAIEVAEVLQNYFRAVCNPILSNGGYALKFIGDGVMAVFSDDSKRAEHHTLRAAKAALGMTLVANQYGTQLGERYAERDLPEFAIGVGLHCGEVVMAQVETGISTELTAIGDTVNLAARLEAKTNEFGWSVVSSLPVLHEAGSGIEFGRIETVWVKGRTTPIDVAEITGLSAQLAGSLPANTQTTTDAGELAATIRAALRENAAITSRAVKAALSTTQPAAQLVTAMAAAKRAQLASLPQIRGFKVTRKIGSGGMSQVFLAKRDTDGQEMALKVLDAKVHEEGDFLSRFIQEHHLISQINHPNIVRIYEQAFSDDIAYIGMEYFPGGDLRRQIVRGLSEWEALGFIKQVAAALQEVHVHNIVHRDLKPDNVMLRDDRSVAIVDFGIAKRVRQSLSTTRHGLVVGTPYYLSPEQARGNEVDTRSDIYSLGVLTYECLTGQKPYQTETVEELMAQHMHAAVPTLRDGLERYQPLLDKMMAKDADARFSHVVDVIQAISKLGI